MCDYVSVCAYLCVCMCAVCVCVCARARACEGNKRMDYNCQRTIDVNNASSPIRLAAAWAGIHDDVPARPSAKGAPVGCQLATMARTIKTVTIQTSGLNGNSCHPRWDRQCIWAELHETGGLSGTLVVNRLRRCPATRPSSTVGKSRRILTNRTYHQC